MNILFLADVPVADPVSGSEQVLFQQASGLAAKGHRVFAVTRREKGPASIVREVGDGITEGSFYADPNDVGQFFSALFRYPGALYDRFAAEITGPFQVVVCHQPFTCLPLLLAKKIKNIPIYYVFHSPSHEEYLLMQKGESFMCSLHAGSRKFIERFCLKRARKAVTLSRFMKQKAEDIHGILAERIVVNPGGVDLERFSPAEDRGGLKKKLNYPEGRTHLFTLRNLEPRMGIDNLVKAVRVLKDENVNLHLTLGGEGAERKSIEKLIVDLDLTNDVTMTGFIASELLPEYYGAADFFILPTRDLEGFGLITPESLACGTPVLGTPVGGTEEILSGFDPRFLFTGTTPQAMAEGIKWGIGHYPVNGDEYKELRSRCRKFVEKRYSWQRHVDQLQTIIE